MQQKNFFLILLPTALFMAVFVLFFSSQKFLLEKPGCYCQGTGEFQFGETQAYFEGKKIQAPLARWELSPSERKVLGEKTGVEKWIEVDLSEQKLRAWEGNNLFLETLISSGKPWTPTITGEFRIWSKFKYAKMEGGEKGTHSYYYLPNVPYIMYFHNGFGLHGTYWHNNFGRTMSHGCVNLPTPVAERLFYWTTPSVDALNAIRATGDNPGTRIVIHE
ncbi:MAG: L,D-transpeptidase [Patescibacteria group bacterium]